MLVYQCYTIICNLLQALLAQGHMLTGDPNLRYLTGSTFKTLDYFVPVIK